MPASDLIPSATKRVALLILLVVGVAALASSDTLHSWLLEWVRWTEAIIHVSPVLGKILFVVFAAISALAAFVSSAVLVPVAVLAWGKAVSMLLLWTGWMLGGCCAFGLSRYLGRKVATWFISRSSFMAYEQLIPPEAPFGLILLFQTALPSEVPGYLLGLARYPFRKYLAALAISELPYAVATIYLGEGFLQRRMWLLIATGVGMAAFSGWTLYWLRSKFSRRVS